VPDVDGEQQRGLGRSLRGAGRRHPASVTRVSCPARRRDRIGASMRSTRAWRSLPQSSAPAGHHRQRRRSLVTAAFLTAFAVATFLALWLLDYFFIDA